MTKGGTTTKGTQGARPRLGEPPRDHLVGETTTRSRKRGGPSTTLLSQSSTLTGTYNSGSLTT
jgi:hypothetical protein